MIEIIPMTLDHIDEVLKIEESSFNIQWTEDDFLRELTQNKTAIYIVAVLDGEIVGYAGLWHVVNEGQITNVAVLPEYRRLGIGEKLMQEFFEIASELNMMGITLEVKISNYAAQKLYTKHGFKPEGFRKNYYKDTNEDAVIMWKYFDVNE